MEDRVLVEVALGSTGVLMIAAHVLRHRPVYINAVFISIITAALCLFAIRSSIPLISVPSVLLQRVFDGTDRRLMLLLFWLMCVLSSLIFCVVVNATDRSTTIHRKFFHLTVSLICMLGLRYDPEFTWLCAWLVICIFVIIEILRSQRVPPWRAYLDDWLLVFVDSQDSGDLILTPIYLLAGIFLPLLLSPIGNFGKLHLYHFAGVSAVGVGDSLAAIVGSRYGRHRWPNSAKTKEGSTAMALGQVLFTSVVCWCYIGECTFTVRSVLRQLFASTVCTLAEAHISSFDNIALPFIAYLLLW